MVVEKQFMSHLLLTALQQWPSEWNLCLKVTDAKGQQQQQKKKGTAEEDEKKEKSRVHRNFAKQILDQISTWCRTKASNHFTTNWATRTSWPKKKRNNDLCHLTRKSLVFTIARDRQCHQTNKAQGFTWINILLLTIIHILLDWAALLCSSHICI